MANLLPSGYGSWVVELKQRILSAEQREAPPVNREQVLLCWQIGRDILARQQAQGWGAKVIDRLATDLTAAFPDMKGFSRRNLPCMRSFAEEGPDPAIVQQAIAHWPWGQNMPLTKLKTRAEREWHAARAVEHGWSRNAMWHHISTQPQQRSGQAVNSTVTWRMDCPSRSKPSFRTKNEPVAIA
jgi:predicted nuclease of restriction endonuclease-like (RecB) superfamily